MTERRLSRETLQVLIAFMLSGCAALMYEVIWTRSLSLVLGSTVYAISTMLSTFMAGLALGAYIGGKFADRTSDNLKLFGLCELGIGVSGLVSVPLIYRLPELYLYIYRTFHLYPSVFFALQVLLCAMVMFVPTTLMGATFPIVSRKITMNLDEMGRKIGDAYSFNTVGAVLGSLSVGFFFIPMLGMKGATAVAAALNAGVGVWMLVLSGKQKAVKTVAVFALAYIAAGSVMAFSDKATSLLNFYFIHRQSGMTYEEIVKDERESYEVLFRKDAPEGEVRALRPPSGELLIQVSGKIEGTRFGDIPNTVLLAYLPIASHPGPKSFLNIGLGTGITLDSARKHIEDVDLVEINPAVMEAVRLHGKPGLLDGIDIFVNDARNHILLTQKRYDIISAEPSYPSNSSVANLFTKEYYEIASRALNDGGIYCQWLPYYLLTNRDVSMMLKTFSSVFPYTYLWKMPLSMDLIMVGSASPIPYSPGEVRARVYQLNKGEYLLDYVLSRTPENVSALRRDPRIPINTDDWPILEFNVADNMLVGDLALVEPGNQ